MARKSFYYSNNTIEMLKKMKNESIEKYSKVYSIEIALIRAICSQESENNNFGLRVEHHLKKAKWYKNTLAFLKKEEVKDYHYCSFGYMQIMFGTARHIGYLGKPFSLCNPELGIKWGCKFLARLIKRFKGNIWDSVAAYNQGNNRFYDINKNGIKDDGEKYYNQKYVDDVKSKFELYSIPPRAVV